MNARFVSLLLLACLALCACGAKSSGIRVDSGVRHYISALRGEDPRPVYEMLTREQREVIPFEDWSAQWRQSHAERALRATELEASLKTLGVLEERATVRFADGKVITLRRQANGWTLDQALIGRNRAATAEDALNVFTAAIDQRQLRSLLSILSSERRQAVAGKLKALRAGLASQAANNWRDIYFLGDKRAELVWRHDGVRYKIVLVSEGGSWLVDDLHLGPDPLAAPQEDEASDSSDPEPRIFRR